MTTLPDAYVTIRVTGVEGLAAAFLELGEAATQSTRAVHTLTASPPAPRRDADGIEHRAECPRVVHVIEASSAGRGLCICTPGYSVPLHPSLDAARAGRAAARLAAEETRRATAPPPAPVRAPRRRTRGHLILDHTL